MGSDAGWKMGGGKRKLNSRFEKSFIVLQKVREPWRPPPPFVGGPDIPIFWTNLQTDSDLEVDGPTLATKKNLSSAALHAL